MGLAPLTVGVARQKSLQPMWRKLKSQRTRSATMTLKHLGLMGLACIPLAGVIGVVIGLVASLFMATLSTPAQKRRGQGESRTEG